MGIVNWRLLCEALKGSSYCRPVIPCPSVKVALYHEKPSWNKSQGTLKRLDGQHKAINQKDFQPSSVVRLKFLLSDHWVNHLSTSCEHLKLYNKNKMALKKLGISNMQFGQGFATSGRYLNTDIIVDGVKATLGAIETYRSVQRKQKSNPKTVASYQEDMTKFLLQQDALKFFPFVVPLCFLPNGILRLAKPLCSLPHYILPRSFWTEDQRKTFVLKVYQKRRKYFKVVNQHIYYHSQVDPDIGISSVLGCIYHNVLSGDVPKNFLLLRFKPVCKQSLNSFIMEEGNVPNLIQAFSKITFVYSSLPRNLITKQLESYAQLLLQLDQKLCRDDLLWNLSIKELEDAALLRGLHSLDLSKKAVVYWLENWLSLTKHCTNDDSWFILHIMVLLSVNYNEYKYRIRVFD